MIVSINAQNLSASPPPTAETLVDLESLPGPILDVRDFNNDGIDDLVILEPLGATRWFGDEQGYYRKEALALGGCPADPSCHEYCPTFCLCADDPCTFCYCVGM